MVVAASGYPEAPRTGDPVTGADGEGVLHAGTAIAELRRAAETLGPDLPTVSTVFVGGGTPTLLPADDLAAAHALSADLRWPHRPADWEQVFALGDGVVAERDGAVVGTALRWRWSSANERECQAARADPGGV